MLTPYTSARPSPYRVAVIGLALVLAFVLALRWWHADPTPSLQPGEWHPGARPRFLRLVEHMAVSSPVADAKTSLASHDTHLIAVGSLHPWVPCVERVHLSALQRTYGIIHFNSGYTTQTLQEDSLRNRAIQYICTYNRYIYGHAYP